MKEKPAHGDDPAHARRLQIWAEIMLQVGRSFADPPKVLTIFTDGIRAVIGAQFAALLAADGLPGVLTARALAMPDSASATFQQAMRDLLTAHRIPVEAQGGLIAQAFFERRDVFSVNCPPEFSAVEDNLKSKLNIQSHWCLPLVPEHAEHSLGVIVLGCDVIEPPPDSLRVFVKGLVEHAALALQNVQLYELERKRRYLADALREASLSLASVLDADNVMEEILRQLSRVLEFDSATIAVPFDNKWRLVALAGEHGVKGEEYELTELGAALQILQTRQPLLLFDAQAANMWQKHDASSFTRAWMGVPLKHGEDVLGVLNISSRRMGTYSAADMDVAAAFANQAAAALVNSRLYHTERQQRALAEAQQKIATSASSSLELSEAAKNVLSLVVSLIPCDAALLALRYGDAMRVIAVHYHPPALVGADLSPTSLHLKMIATQQPVWLDDVLQVPELKEWSHMSPFRSWVAAPMVMGERVVGYVALQALATGRFGNEPAELLGNLSRQAALALENAQLYGEATRRLQQLALLNDIAAAASAAPDFDLIAWHLTHSLTHTAHYESVRLWLVDDVSGELVGKSYSPLDDEKLVNILDYTPAVWRAKEQGKPVQVESDSGPSASQLCVPIRIGSTVLGVIDAQSERPKAFSDDDAHLLSIVAGQLATALENARLYARSQQSVRDLSESLDQLRQAQAQLIQSAKLAAVGQLAAGVAHEINNPLTTIAGFSELLLHDLGPNSPQRDDLAMILREARRARDVVRRLLEFARQTESHRDLADLNQLASDTVMLLKHSASTVSRVHIVEQYHSNLPWVLVDVNQLKQVIVNLLNNAIQAMPHGGQLTLGTGEEDGGVCLKVLDTGVGIPPENLEHIFEPFFTTKPPGEGTGLGLSVSYGIIRDHGGRLEVSSQVGEGSIFTLWLPIGATPKEAVHE